MTSGWKAGYGAAAARQDAVEGVPHLRHARAPLAREQGRAAQGGTAGATY